MLKDITSEKGKRLNCHYQVIYFSTKIQDTCNDYSNCLNSQKNKSSFDFQLFLLHFFFFFTYVSLYYQLINSRLKKVRTFFTGKVRQSFGSLCFLL